MAGSDSHDTDPLADTSVPSAAETTRAKKRPVHTGDVIGRYELGDDVGEGGMATVYRARDKELRREVAVKVLFPHLARRPEIVRRFHREARAAAGLEHANILRIYDVGGDEESDDPPFIVMELIRGTTLLGEIEQRGPMFAEVAACVGALLADALAAAHAAGIVHRDIKPANVLIAQEGRLLLADFGVARLETEDSLVTKTGALLGTPAYMSPEQAQGDIATAKSDLYSLGATLYQLATGSLPYTGSPAKVMSLIATGARVPAVKKRAEVGPDLSKVIDRLMATEPAERPASAKEVASELRAIAAAGGLGDPADELAAYFTDPKSFVAAKTPAVVTALVAAGKLAIAEHKLPRALAIADRAGALAPDDPTVTALITEVTEGGRGGSRRRVIGLVVLGAAVMAGGAFAGVKLLGGGDPVPDAAAVVAIATDAPVIAVDGAVLAELDAGVLDAPVVVASARDAGRIAIAVVRDAGLPDSAAIVEAVIPDAPPPPPLPIDAAQADGKISVANDTWCDVYIDNQKRGRAKDGPYVATAGHHAVRCEQEGTLRKWKRDVEVVANQTATVSGTMLAEVEIRFEIDASVDGIAHVRGDRVRLKPRQITIEANGQRRYTALSGPCTIRDRPELDCFGPTP